MIIVFSILTYFVIGYFYARNEAPLIIKNKIKKERDAWHGLYEYKSDRYIVERSKDDIGFMLTWRLILWPLAIAMKPFHGNLSLFGKYYKNVQEIEKHREDADNWRKNYKELGVSEEVAKQFADHCDELVRLKSGG